MNTSPKEEVTRLLHGIANGDRSGTDALLALVYDELRALAQSWLARERPDHTLQATALVHEAYLRLVDQRDTEWTCRAQFIAVASEMIRRVLVDHARARATLKRGGDASRLTLSDAEAIRGRSVRAGVDMLELDDAMLALAALDERQARVVELRFFGGLTVDEAAHVLGVSPRTVKNDWRVARAWLRTHMDGSA